MFNRFKECILSISGHKTFSCSNLSHNPDTCAIAQKGKKYRYIGLFKVFRLFGQTKERKKRFLAKTPSQYDFCQKSLKFRRISIFLAGGVGMDFAKKSLCVEDRAIYEPVLFYHSITSSKVLLPLLQNQCQE